MKKVQSAYERLAEKKSWGELIALCEKEFTAKGEDDSEARLWWIRAQLAERNIPVSILAAPLESAANTVMKEGSSEQSALLEVTLCEVSTALQAEEEFELAITFLERAYRLNKAHLPDLQALIEICLTAYKTQNIYGKELTALKERIKHLEELKAILQDQNVTAKDVSEAAPEKQDSLPPKPTAKDNGRFFILNAKVMLTAIIICAGAATGWYYYPRIHTRLLEAAAPTITPLDTLESAIFEPAKPPTMLLPKVKRVVYPSRSNLQDILKSLETPAPVLEETNTLPKKQPAKEVISTKGPTEPAELTAALQTARERDPLGELKERTQQAFKSPILRGESHNNTIVSGHPMPILPKARDRQIINEFYEVITNTVVRSSPSEDGRILSELSAGDAVEVAEREGRWLRIISVKNRAGYIPAEAARPEKR